MQDALQPLAHHGACFLWGGTVLHYPFMHGQIVLLQAHAFSVAAFTFEARILRQLCEQFLLRRTESAVKAFGVFLAFVGLHLKLCLL